ncbi:MAG: hemolysin III family protein [Dongiaceae bacterium]
MTDIAGPRRFAAAERRADRWVHGAGLAAGLIASLAMVPLVARHCGPHHQAAIALYLATLLAMLGCSAAYHVFAASPHREWLRRVDHAVIYLLIAGTYTPFAAAHLDEARPLLLTLLVWLIAGLGFATKLVFPRRFEGLGILAYLLLGWLEFLGLSPYLGGLGTDVLWLLAAGGLLYSGGVVFLLWRRLPFHIALWHLLVLIAAGCHYLAVLEGVVLARCQT